MNSFLFYDPNFLLQQQLLFQQLVQYNTMFALRNAYSMSQSLSPQIQPKSPQECHTIDQNTVKNDETIDDQSSFELSKSNKIKKLIKKTKETKSNANNTSVKNQKKKIFLSMKDIKDVQYKKFKLVQEEQIQEDVKNPEEKK
ncbi:unnamed protein product (macronuclear) [Paramecium tetraurelia]|uniref:Uncharacterized protein n=1 Tax=Paramecium tetraurelia TaxID=5888 RepID=A0DG22_PARTE|nr:uncharacterized protein GSPATT00002117001 [Paramecium tetraurelia]CAK81989.1 unnamed protein product [Paramecium tetraurelia]|eukprot:XP_001449386.1 hypothetical protein (macronuclear) [Paramecium tetraurelia strain d4-2]